MSGKPMRGTTYTVRLNKMTDDEARREFESWLATTGRGRFIDWGSIQVDQLDSVTVVRARVK